MFSHLNINPAPTTSNTNKFQLKSGPNRTPPLPSFLPLQNGEFLLPLDLALAVGSFGQNGPPVNSLIGSQHYLALLCNDKICGVLVTVDSTAVQVNIKQMQLAYQTKVGARLNQIRLVDQNLVAGVGENGLVVLLELKTGRIVQKYTNMDMRRSISISLRNQEGETAVTVPDNKIPTQDQEESESEDKRPSTHIMSNSNRNTISNLNTDDSTVTDSSEPGINVNDIDLLTPSLSEPPFGSTSRSDESLFGPTQARQNALVVQQEQKQSQTESQSQSSNLKLQRSTTSDVNDMFTNDPRLRLKNLTLTQKLAIQRQILREKSMLEGIGLQHPSISSSSPIGSLRNLSRSPRIQLQMPVSTWSLAAGCYQNSATESDSGPGKNQPDDNQSQSFLIIGANDHCVKKINLSRLNDTSSKSFTEPNSNQEANSNSESDSQSDIQLLFRKKGNLPSIDIAPDHTFGVVASLDGSVTVFDLLDSKKDKKLKTQILSCTTKSSSRYLVATSGPGIILSAGGGLKVKVKFDYF